MSYRKIEPASPITFRADHGAPPYLVLTMAQVESLRDRDKFDAFMAWAQARARLAALRARAQATHDARIIHNGGPAKRGVNCPGFPHVAGIPCEHCAA